MSRGKSGRIVLEIDPRLKARLYTLLSADGKTLKEWFVGQAERYISDTVAPQFNFLPSNSDAAGDRVATR